MSKLTEQQKLFCQEYITDLNATQAAIRANYSEDSASQQGSRLLTIDKVQEYVAKLQKPIRERAEITLESHLKRLKHLSNMAETAEQYSAAIKAEESRGKASGLYVDKKEITGKDGEDLIPNSITIKYD